MQHSISQSPQTAVQMTLFWDGSAVATEVVHRGRIPARLKAGLLLSWALVPLELLALALLAGLAGSGGFSALCAVAAAGTAAHTLLDPDGWRAQIRGALWTLAHGESVVVGEADGCRFFLPAEALGGPARALVIPYGGGYALDLHAPGLEGEIRNGTDRWTVASAAAQGRWLPMTAGLRCRLRFGRFALLVDSPDCGDRSATRWFTAQSTEPVGYIAASAVVHAGMLVMFVLLPPEEDIQVKRPNHRELRGRLIAVESILYRDKARRREEVEALQEVVDVDAREVVLAEETPHVRASERLVERDTPLPADRASRPSAGRSAPAPRAPERRPEGASPGRAAAERLIAAELLAGVTGRDLSVRAPALDIRIVGKGPNIAGGEPSGPTTIAAHTGTETGGGYGSLDFGPAVPRTRSDGGDFDREIVAELDKRGDWNARKRPVLAEKEPKPVAIEGPVTVRGDGLTKPIVQQYMDRQKGGLIACYRKEVQRLPNLEGSVVLTFTISPSGKVMMPGVKSSTLGSSAAERCMVARLGLFRFPMAESAAPLRVNYPLHFRTR